jgi:hypothetical protein
LVSRFSADQALTGLREVVVKFGSSHRIVARGTARPACHYRPATSSELG